MHVMPQEGYSTESLHYWDKQKGLGRFAFKLQWQRAKHRLQVLVHSVRPRPVQAAEAKDFPAFLRDVRAQLAQR